MADALEKKRMNRTLTQKYDMTSLRALQVLESKFLGELAAVYSVPEDDVPVELDLLCIYNMDASLRLKAVQDLVKDAPQDTSVIVNQLIEDMIVISEMPKKA